MAPGAQSWPDDDAEGDAEAAAERDRLAVSDGETDRDTRDQDRDADCDGVREPVVGTRDRDAVADALLVPLRDGETDELDDADGTSVGQMARMTSSD